MGPTKVKALRADGAVVCEDCVVADSFARRLLGLMGRADLPSGRGLLLRRTKAVHTHFMRFPIDVVFLDEHDCVVRVVERLRPWRAATAARAVSALELRAGDSERAGLRVGSALAWRPAEAAA